MAGFTLTPITIRAHLDLFEAHARRSRGWIFRSDIAGESVDISLNGRPGLPLYSYLNSTTSDCISNGLSAFSGRTRYAAGLWPNRVVPAFCFLLSEKIPTLGRNLALVSVLYSVNARNDFAMTQNQGRRKPERKLKQ